MQIAEPRYAAVSMNLSRSATRTFTDPDHAASALRSGAAKYKVLGNGVFHAESTIVELDALTVQCERAPRARRVPRAAARQGGVPRLAARTAAGRAGHAGRARRADVARSRHGGVSPHHGRSTIAALLVDASELERARDRPRRPRALHRERTAAAPRRIARSTRLLSLLDDARRIARSTPEVFETAEARHALEQSLLHATIACLDDAAPVRELPTTRAAPRSCRASKPSWETQRGSSAPRAGAVQPDRRTRAHAAQVLSAAPRNEPAPVSSAPTDLPRAARAAARRSEACHRHQHRDPARLLGARALLGLVPLDVRRGSVGDAAPLRLKRGPELHSRSSRDWPSLRLARNSSERSAADGIRVAWNRLA